MPRNIMAFQGTLPLLNTWEEQTSTIERVIRAQAAVSEPLHILEAGCGRGWPFQIDDLQYVLTGVDLDEEALRIRKEVRADLHEAIKGDLCSVKLPAGKFDVIYSSYVLEHIQQADLVLRNFVTWAKDQGAIILKIPDPYSVHGYVTRVTPHWFHVLFYRFVLGNRDAGKPGFGPYPTFYHPLVSRPGIRKFCAENGLLIEAEYGLTGARHTKKEKLVHVIRWMIGLLSLGFLDAKHNNLLYVVRNTTCGRAALNRSMVK